MIYLYESHHGGLYLSARDDLDADYCPICGDCDSKMEIYDIEDLEDARMLVYDLFSQVITEGFGKETWYGLLDGLKKLYNDIDFGSRPTKEEWESSVDYHTRILLDKLEEYVEVRNE